MKRLPYFAFLTLTLIALPATAAPVPSSMAPSSTGWTFPKIPLAETEATRAVDYASKVALCPDGAAVVAGRFTPKLQIKGQNSQVDSYLELRRAGSVVAPVTLALLENRQVGGLVCASTGTLFVASTPQGGGSILLERVQRKILSASLEWSINTLAAQKGIVVNPGFEAEVVGLEPDGAGNLYLLSNLRGEHPTLPNQGDWDVVVQKVSADSGAVLWSVRLGSGEMDKASDLAVGADGRLWVVGETKGPLEGQMNHGGSDAFALSLDASSGKVLQTVLFGSPANNVATSVGVSDAGQVYVGGYTYGPLESSADPSTSAPATSDADGFVVRLETQPTLRVGAVQALADQGVSDAVRHLVMLPKGQLIAVGDTDGTLSGQTSAGDKDLTLTLLGENLKVIRRQQVGTPGSDGAFGVARSKAGETWVVGRGAEPAQNSASGSSSTQNSAALLFRWRSALEPSPGLAVYRTLGASTVLAPLVPPAVVAAPDTVSNTVPDTVPAAFARLLTQGKRLELRVSKPSYRLGEAIALEVASPIDGYLNIVEYNPDQTVTVLFPNKFTPENAVMAGQTLKLPGDKFEFFAVEPLGTSHLLAFVSPTPLNLYREASTGVDPSGFRTFVNLEACNCVGTPAQKVGAAGLTTLETVR